MYIHSPMHAVVKNSLIGTVVERSPRMQQVGGLYSDRDMPLEVIKQKAYRPHRSPETQLQSINTLRQSYDTDYTKTLIERHILFENVNPLHSRMLCAKCT